MNDPYETLGVGRDADTETIERAYRSKARKLHPDAGGDASEFKRASEARSLLVDPERRQRYDQTGDASDQPKTAATQAEAKLAGLVQEAFLQDCKSPIRWMQDTLDRERSDIGHHLQRAKTRKAVIERRFAKFVAANEATTNKSGRDLIRGVLEVGLAELSAVILDCEQKRGACTDALALLNDLTCEPDAAGFIDRRTVGTVSSFWLNQ